jgi:gamma-glutamyltranspeptidase / glutathione hydrolase
MMTRTARIAASLLLASAIALVACQHTPAPSAHGTNAGAAAPRAKSRAGVGAANPLAVEAGLTVLRDGGNAVDAAVAVQAALGLVEPQSSGLGGGAFLVFLDGKTGKITAFEGRETAPAGATPDMFIGEDGKPLSYADAVTSGRSTGAPGAIAMLGLAHDRFGRLPWRDLFATATRAADHGFSVPKRLARFAGGEFPQATLPDARALFSRPDGTPVQAGDTLTNPAYAQTLRAIASNGPRTLLDGPIAAHIATRTRAEPRPGTMTAADLAAYHPHEVEPLCRPYRVYVLCVPPPPSSGVSLLEMLAILAQTDIASRGPSDPQAWFLFAEASRLMYADRDQYVADPAFVRVPVAGLLDPGYVATRAALIGSMAGPAPAAGVPPGLTARLGRDATNEAAGTSHFVVVDGDGNVVSMTTTVESIFGSGRAVDGFFLNNQLTDFSFRAVEDGKPVANAVAPGKRPRSSMSPLIVLDRDGRFLAALGSPGGSAILTYDAKTIVGLLDWGLTMQQAIDLPNLYARGTDFYGEVTKFPPEVLAALAARGVVVKAGRGEESGLHGVIVRDGGSLEGGADPRREGQWRELEVRPAQASPR